jgi:hypothetical protein
VVDWLRSPGYDIYEAVDDQLRCLEPVLYNKFYKIPDLDLLREFLRYQVNEKSQPS